MKKWKELTPEEQQKRIAWSVATSCAIESRQDPVDIYNRIMEDYRNISGSNESQNSEKP
jgi:transcription elongation factor Elf1